MLQEEAGCGSCEQDRLQSMLSRAAVGWGCSADVKLTASSAGWPWTQTLCLSGPCWPSLELKAAVTLTSM